MADDPTVGELTRRLDRIEARVDGRVVSLNTYHAERTHDRDEVSAVRHELTAWRTDIESEITDLRHDIKALSEGMARTVRLAATGVLSPIIVGLVLWLITRGR